MYQKASVAISLLFLVTVTTAAVIFLIGRRQSESDLVITGGFAGGSAATFALIVQSRGWSVLTSGIARHGLIAAFSSVVAGFLAGAFSVLAAIALIGDSVTVRNGSGAAILGGIYGLLLGAYWSRIVLSSEDKETLLGTAISEISGRVIPGIVNYHGKVHASLSPAENGQLVRGRVVVWFSADRAKHAAQDTAGIHATAPIIIQGGSRKARTEFVVTILGTSTTTPFPRRQLVVAPTGAESQRYEFSLVQEGSGTDASTPDVAAPASDAAASSPDLQVSAVPAASQVALGPILIDVSQSGRTVQVLEVSQPAGKAGPDKAGPE